MKKILSLLFVIVLSLCMAIAATAATEKNLSSSLGNSLTDEEIAKGFEYALLSGSDISEIAIYGFDADVLGTDVVIPETICGIKVTRIYSGGVFGWKKLTSLTIPDSVTNIGDSAFEGCTGLKSVTIPDSVTSIDHHAFSSCDGLTSVTIGSGVRSIGDSAFEGCTSLAKINWNAENVEDFSEYNTVFSSAGTSGNGIDVVFGDNVKRIPAYLFYSLDDDYYYESPKIKTVTIGNSVTSIGNYAFDGCTGLTSITIPNSVTKIGAYAFENCTGLTRINWNAENVADFNRGWCVFLDAGSSDNGIDVVFGDNVKSIPAYLFYAEDLNVDMDDTVHNLPRIKTVTIGKSVTSVGDYAFRDCTELTSITIPSSVKKIGEYSFYGCKGLENVTIPQNVRVIGKNAFRGCPGIKTMTFENKQISIGNYAFGYDESLMPYEDFTIKGYDRSSAEIYALLNGFDFVSLDKEEHVHYYTVKTYVQPTCLSIGYEVHVCSCGDTYAVTLPALGHTDEDNNGVCDRCEEKLAAQPEEPTQPDTPSDDKNNDDKDNDNAFVAFFKQIIELLKKLFNLLSKRA